MEWPDFPEGTVQLDMIVMPLMSRYGSSTLKSTLDFIWRSVSRTGMLLLTFNPPRNIWQSDQSLGSRRYVDKHDKSTNHFQRGIGSWYFQISFPCLATHLSAGNPFVTCKMTAGLLISFRNPSTLGACAVYFQFEALRLVYMLLVSRYLTPVVFVMIIIITSFLAKLRSWHGDRELVPGTLHSHALLFRQQGINIQSW